MTGRGTYIKMEKTLTATVLLKGKHRLDISTEGYGFMSKSSMLSVGVTRKNLFEAFIKRRCYASGDEGNRVKFAKKS